MVRTVEVPAPLAPVFAAAEKLVGAFFATRVDRPEEARIEIGGERFLLLRASSLSIDFHDAMRELFDAGSDEALGFVTDLLFHLAHDLGKTDAAAMRRKLGVDDPLALLAAGPAQFVHQGWASVRILPESRAVPGDDCVFVYDHPHSFEADSWVRAGRRANRPVCAMNAGYSSGWASAAFGVELVATELACVGCGDASCRFVMAPPHRLVEEAQRHLRDHPEIAGRVGAVATPRRVDTAELAARLEASEARYRQLFESSMDAILVVERGAITGANRAAVELLGRPKEALLGHDFASLAPPRQADGRTSGEVFAAHAAAALKGDHCRLDWRLSRRDGRLVDTELTIVRVDGQEETLEVIARDVSERVRAVKERQRLEQELRQLQKMDALGTLAGGVAHDFNNLLAAIAGNLDLLERSADLGSARDYLDGARDALARSEGIVRQLLTFARVSQELEVVVDLRRLVEENLVIFRETIDRRIAIRAELPHDRAEVRGDPSYLAQALANLVLNARDALVGDLDGRDDARIDVEVRSDRRAPPDGEPANVVGIVVRDNGGGMDAETTARAFEPFFSTKGAGAGLGLSTVYGIVQQHRGWVEIRSEPGEGTEVVAWLPRVEPASTAPTVARRTPPAARPLRVLVVEDEPALRKVIAAMLSDRGHEVALASDGLEGVATYEAEAGSIDVVLLDLTMPGLSGRAALARIRAVDPEQPVIVMSGYSADGRASDLLELGARGFLAKPFGAAELARAVEEATR